jgi:hypothetical protein
LVITYDEHGGLYDHVKPPESCGPGGYSWRGITRRIGAWLRARADRKAGRTHLPRFDFRQLGVRVPTVVVSPWIGAGTIIPQTLDHSSIPHTVRELFLPIDSKPLNKRDQEAKTFHHIVTQSPLAGPRPSPGEPNPNHLPPVPDLRAATRAHDTAAVARGPASPPASPAPTTAVDRELVALAAHVDAKLRRHPTTVAARRRAAKLGHGDSLAARNGEVFPADQPLTLFRAAAKTARRRPVTRPPA